MDLWILYNESYDKEGDNPASRMLVDAKCFNIKAELKFYQYFNIRNDLLYYKNELANLPKIAFIRGQDSKLMEYLERKGVRTINSSFTIKSSLDKLKTHRIVNRLNIKQILTYEYINESFSDIEGKVGLPFIFKYRFGNQGKGVYLINSESEFKEILNNIEPTDFIYQEYIKESYGRDVRLYIIGDKVIGACLRVNNTDFKSNLHRGGLSFNYTLNEKLINDALKIKAALRGDIISVDFLVGNEGLLFCEANTNAGFASFNYLGYPTRYLMMKYIKGLL